MSLVPILYTSLLIFAVLMIVIISISYISFKIRSRNNFRDEEEAINYNKQTQFSNQPQNHNVQSIKVVPTIKNPQLQKSSPLPYKTQRTTVINSSDMEVKNRNTTFNNIENHTQKKTYNTTDYYIRRTNPSSFKNRIEIINKLVPEESPKEKFIASGSGSIALPKYFENFKAIQYYSDEEDEYFYKPSNHFD